MEQYRVHWLDSDGWEHVEGPFDDWDTARAVADDYLLSGNDAKIVQVQYAQIARDQ